jgi:hypothetical protein
VEELRTRYEEALEEALGEDAEIHWHATEGRAGAANDQLRVVHATGGYGALEVEEAVSWSVRVCSTWLELTWDLPPELLDG